MKRQLTVLGALAAALVLSVGVAFAMGLLNLPLIPVAVTHGPWLGGTSSTLDITLGSVPPGYDVSDGTYVGWCLEDNFLDDPPDGELYPLVDSTDDPANFPHPCENYADIPWDRVNYLLNHKAPTATAWEIQLALWEVAGTESGVYDPLPPLAQAMVVDTLLNGTGFHPQLGGVVAVAICADGIDVGTPDGMWQDTIIEVLFDGDGCTPGYWRQPQHFDSWPPPYFPSQYFDLVFGVGPHLKLKDAVKTNGGGETALLRHATAALLNAASPDVMYQFSVAEVIALVQQAYATGDFEGVKNLFEAANENYCPLD